jgi:hypothetical protein
MAMLLRPLLGHLAVWTAPIDEGYDLLDLLG